MKKVLLLLLLCLGLSACMSGVEAGKADHSVVPSLDLNRFMGKWYEIARYDHRFERGMTQVTATYTLLENGGIQVLNEGWKEGECKQVKGRAKLPDAAEPGKLKVSFFLWFYADYYVLDIDDDYRYVLVGSSSDDYLWLMSRERTMPEPVLREWLDKISRRGYDTSKLIFVDQGNGENE